MWNPCKLHPESRFLRRFLFSTILIKNMIYTVVYPVAMTKTLLKPNSTCSIYMGVKTILIACQVPLFNLSPVYWFLNIDTKTFTSTFASKSLFSCIQTLGLLLSLGAFHIMSYLSISHCVVGSVYYVFRQLDFCMNTFFKRHPLEFFKSSC